MSSQIEATEDDVMEELMPDEMTIHTGNYCGDVTGTDGKPVGLWVMLAVDDSTPWYRTHRKCSVDMTCGLGVEAMAAAIAALTAARDALALLPADANAPEVPR